MTGATAGPSTYSFRRYLLAKRTVDDRALDRRVLGALERALDRRADAGDGPLDVVEVGAGVGAMLARLLAWDRLPGEVAYTAVDLDPETIAVARERLPCWAAEAGHEVAHAGTDRFEFRRDDRRVTVDLVAADALAYVDADDDRDLLVGCAFADLLDLETAVPRLLAALAPGGLCYFPITFDGGTGFEPSADPAFDARVERRYHHHMDERRADPGDSRAGRHLLGELRAAGGEVVAAGGSDWAVHPVEGGYPADEAYFLHHVLDTVRGALADDPALDADRFGPWVERRHRQVEAGELSYVAHNLDVLGRKPE